VASLQAGWLLQLGVAPGMWGITLDQLRDVAEDPRHTDGMTVRDVVERIVKPDTLGTKAGYALLKNADRPLKASVMVSHAWDAKYSDVLGALAASGEQGPFWVCAMALHQGEGTPSVTIERQLTMVLETVDVLVCLLTASCNVFTRLWCLFEVFIASRLGLEVRVASRKTKFGLGAIDELLIKFCERPVDSRNATCGTQAPGTTPRAWQRGQADEAALRRAIEAVADGYDAVDRVVEEARLTALIRNRDRLIGGGWKDTSIGREYLDVIREVGARLPRAPLETARSDAACSTDAWLPCFGRTAPRVSAAAAAEAIAAGGVETPSPGINKDARERSTPRATTRQHWAPTLSI